MARQFSRRALLMARANHAAMLRPPQARPEVEFLARCDGCRACSDACPQHILKIADGAPQMDFSLGAGECTFCGECTAACPTGALDAACARDWSWTAEIAGRCLSLKGVSCRACNDACEPRAIRFQLMPGCRDVPLIDEAACTGCGACAGVCPVDAIRFTELAGRLTEAAE